MVLSRNLVMVSFNKKISQIDFSRLQASLTDTNSLKEHNTDNMHMPCSSGKRLEKYGNNK